jgi:drug/metabolite transporter (DMT)-like permease
LSMDSVSSRPSLAKAYWALGIVSFFWGTTYLAMRIGAHDIPGMFLAGIRNLTAGSILVSFFLLKGHRFPAKEVLWKIALQGFFMLAIGNGLMTWSMQFITSGLAAILGALVPLLMAVFSLMMLENSRFTRPILIGLLLGFLGIGAIFYEYLSDLLNPKFSFGIMLCVIATSSWAFGSVFTARNAQFSESRQLAKPNPLFSAGIQMLTAGMILTIISFVTGHTVDLGQVPAKALYSLIYLILIGSLLSYVAYVYALSKLPPSQVSVYAYVNPVVAVILGYLVLQEKLNLYVGLGVAITLAGVYLVNNEFRKQSAR